MSSLFFLLLTNEISLQLTIDDIRTTTYKRLFSLKINLCIQVHYLLKNISYFQNWRTAA